MPTENYRDIQFPQTVEIGFKAKRKYHVKEVTFIII